MTPEEIQSICTTDMFEDKFEILDAAGVTIQQVEDAVDEDTAKAYSHWIYLNVK